MSIGLSAHFMLNFLSLVGNSDVSVEREIIHTLVFIDAILQIFYPSVSGSIERLSIGINPDNRQEIMYELRIYKSFVPGTNLIALSKNVTLAAGTSGQFYDFTFPSRIKSGWWIHMEVGVPLKFLYVCPLSQHYPGLWL